MPTMLVRGPAVHEWRQARGPREHLSCSGSLARRPLAMWRCFAAPPLWAVTPLGLATGRSLRIGADAACKCSDRETEVAEDGDRDDERRRFSGELPCVPSRAGWGGREQKEQVPVSAAQVGEEDAAEHDPGCNERKEVMNQPAI